MSLKADDMLDAAEIKRRVPIDAILRHYGSFQDREGRWRCPFPSRHRNGDAHHSVTVKDGRVFCWSQDCFGEHGADVFELVGRMEALSNFPDQKRRVCEIGGIVDAGNGNGQRRIAATYDYTDEAGVLLYQVVRFAPKDFRQRQPDGNGGWIWNLKDTRLVLYRLPDVIRAETVLIVEGEKDILTACRLGLPEGWAATCNPMGAGKWRPEFSDALQGKRVVILPDADEPGRRHGEQVARSLHGKAAAILTVRLPHGKDLSEWAEVGGTADKFEALLNGADVWHFKDSSEAPPNETSVLVRLADVQPEAVTWLWPGRIARGKLTLLVGDPGVGKSMLTMDLAARISRGAAFPDGPKAPGGTVIILTAEDGLADTVRPRLDAMEGDPAQVVVLFGIRTSDDSTPRYFQLTTDLNHMEQAITKYNAMLVVIDPLSAYLGDRDPYKDSEIRQVLGPLSAMAERTGVAIVGVMHLGKNEQRKALYRVLSSIAFVAAARAVFVVASDPDTEGRVLFLPLKMNIAPKPPGLAYRLDGPRIVWDTCPVTVDAESALRGADLPEEREERAHAVSVLRELLQGGPMKATDVKKEAAIAGIPERTLYRAKATMRVKAHRIGGLGSTGWWEWELPHSPQPDHAKTAKTPKTANPPCRENMADLGESGSLSADAGAAYPIGTRIRFNGGLGFEEAGTVEGHTSWIQYPGQTCYRVGGRTVPHSRVLGVEG
jgi:5S rRNA maturation endonuclease (ribonuclease M5)